MPDSGGRPLPKVSSTPSTNNKKSLKPPSSGDTTKSLRPSANPKKSIAKLRGSRVRHQSLFSTTDSLISEDSISDELPNTPSGWVSLIIIVIVMILVLVLTLLGMAIFMNMGKDEEIVDVMDNCQKEARDKVIYMVKNNISQIPRKELLTRIDQAFTKSSICLTKSKMILTGPDAAVYSWSLFSTVGYGDMYMQSNWGRLVTVIYSFFSSALYLAAKAEFGQIISRHLSDAIHHIRMLFRRCLKNYDHPHPIRPLFRFLICLGLLSIMMTFLAVYMKLSQVDWAWSTSFYFAYITMALIGLGDVTPNHKIHFIICAQPILLIGDTLFAQINWYMQDRLRFALYKILRLHTNDSDKEDEQNKVRNYPTVTSKMIPLDYSVENSLTTIPDDPKDKKKKKRRIRSRMRDLVKPRKKNTLADLTNEEVFGPDKQPLLDTTTNIVTKEMAK